MLDTARSCGVFYFAQNWVHNLIWGLPATKAAKRYNEAKKAGVCEVGIVLADFKQ